MQTVIERAADAADHLSAQITTITQHLGHGWVATEQESGWATPCAYELAHADCRRFRLAITEWNGVRMVAHGLLPHLPHGLGSNDVYTADIDTQTIRMAPAKLEKPRASAASGNVGPVAHRWLRSLDGGGHGGGVDMGQSVRCEVPYFPAAVVGLSLVWLGGLGVAGLRWLRHHPVHPGEFLILGGLLALTVCTGLLRSRYVVRAVEFTKAQIRLESRAGVQTVRISDVRAVWIEHTGDTASGYVETSLHLNWRNGSRSLVCRHDPALGQALVRLLPSRVTVEERWDQLREPSSG